MNALPLTTGYQTANELESLRPKEWRIYAAGYTDTHPEQTQTVEASRNAPASTGSTTTRRARNVRSNRKDDHDHH